MVPDPHPTNPRPTRIVHLPGPTDYHAIHQLQQRLVAARAADTIGDVVLLLEHAPTITLGRTRGSEASVLPGASAPVVKIERGGDATWHGPGQLVAYPIVALQGERRDLHRHLHALEDAVIALLQELGTAPVRDPRNTGVWLPIEGSDRPHKVCSIGIACRRWVTWHGLALNVDVDLGAFEQIRPCGFDASVMTRLADHLRPCPSPTQLVQPLAAHLCAALSLPWEGVVHSDVDL